jgi:hypothetical protein
MALNEDLEYQKVYGYSVSFNGTKLHLEWPPAGDASGVIEYLWMDDPAPIFRSHPALAVAEFHLAYGCEQIVGSTDEMFSQHNDNLINLRMDLIEEEFLELLDAEYQKKPAEVVDALLDLIYVCYGMLLALKFPACAGFAEVHRSNMSKLGVDGLPIRRADGKILKGPNYSPPDLESLLNWAQRAEFASINYANAEDFVQNFSAPGVEKEG